MARVWNFTHTDSAISGNPTMQISMGKPNFAADYVVDQTEVKKGEVILNSLRSASNALRRIKFGHRKIANVFTGSGIKREAQGSNGVGTQLFVQITDVIVGSEEGLDELMLPIKATFSLVVPDHPVVTPALMQTYALYLAACLHETGLTTTTRLAAWSRGQLLPSDLK